MSNTPITEIWVRYKAMVYGSRVLPPAEEQGAFTTFLAGAVSATGLIMNACERDDVEDRNEVEALVEAILDEGSANAKRLFSVESDSRN